MSNTSSSFPSPSHIKTALYLAPWGIPLAYLVIMLSAMVVERPPALTLKMIPVLFVIWVVRKRLAVDPADNRMRIASSINQKQLLLMLAVELLPLLALLVLDWPTIAGALPAYSLAGLLGHLALGWLGHRQLNPKA